MCLCWCVSVDGAALLLLLLHGRVLCACVFRDEECAYLQEVLQRNRCPCLMIVKILWPYSHVFVGRAPSHTTNHHARHCQSHECHGEELPREEPCRLDADH
jgi:hypothetical protein